MIGRNEAKLDEVVAEIEHDGGKAERAAADIRDEDAVTAVSGIVTRHGRIHGLVNNAGGRFPSPLMFITKKGFDAVLARTSRAALS